MTALPINQAEIAGETRTTVSTRDLYPRLHMPKSYDDWLWDTLPMLRLQPGTDYEIEDDGHSVRLTIHAAMVFAMHEDHGLEGIQLFREMVRYEERGARQAVQA